MYGKMLTHDWFTQIRLSPHGVPSRTRPNCAVAAPAVDEPEIDLRRVGIFAV